MTAEDPSGERPATDEELFDRARKAVGELRARGRLANGQAGQGNTLNLRHGLRSVQLLAQPDVQEWHSAQVEAITGDLGGDGELTALARASIREVARLEVILAALGQELMTGGVLTGKGNTRAATLTYLQVLDRFTRLSGNLGLQRRQKPTNPLDAVRRAVKEANS